MYDMSITLCCIDEIIYLDMNSGMWFDEVQATVKTFLTFIILYVIILKTT